LFSFLIAKIQQKNETTKFFGGFLRKKKFFFSKKGWGHNHLDKSPTKQQKQTTIYKLAARADLHHSSTG
jgi:hypothetical protein